MISKRRTENQANRIIITENHITSVLQGRRCETNFTYKAKL